MSGGRLSFIPYADSSFSSPKGEEFVVTINPSAFKITSRVDYHLSQGMGTGDAKLRYSGSAPKVLSFSLLLDNTGVFPNTEEDITSQLTRLQKVAYDFQEDIHSPYYIRIVWGKLDFHGRLIELNSDFDNFLPVPSEPVPVGGKIDIKVIEAIEYTTNARKQANAAKQAAAGSMSEDVVAGQAGAAGGAAGAAAADGTSGGEAGAGGKGSETASGEGEGAAGSATDEAAKKAGAEGDNDAALDDAARADAEGMQNEEAAGAMGDAAGEGVDAEDAMAQHAVKDGDSLPAVTDKAGLPDSSLEDVAALNSLDSLRDLASGMSLALPNLGLAALLAALLKKALDYAKKGLAWLKEKGKKAYDAGKKKAKKVKDTGKKSAEKAKKKATDTKKAKEKAQEKMKDMTDRGKKTAANMTNMKNKSQSAATKVTDIKNKGQEAMGKAKDFQAKGQEAMGKAKQVTDATSKVMGK